jgi:hypothetical protein
MLVCLLGAVLWGSVAMAQEPTRGRVANPHGTLNIRCENCHTSTAWKPIRKQPEFDHDRQTTFKLQGLHQGVECQSCHTSLVFTNAPTRCAECHADLHRRQFGADCQSCHTVNSWKVAISSVQQHNNRFPLIGAHAAVVCDACHHGAAAGVYTGLSTECVSCHLTDYQKAAPLNHVRANLPVTCQNCHTINAWTGASFNHSLVASFPLTGLHTTVACAQCHVKGVFAATPLQCAGCHLADYNRTTNPNHQASKFATTCEGCHKTSGWQNATFDHNLSRFPLTGAHTSVTCAQCHVNGAYTGTATQCAGCHLSDFQKTTRPNHATAGFPQDCATCHTTTNWSGATFNHATTGFALAGLHATQQCATCHVDNNYNLTSAACWGCHQTDFNGANNPPHKSAGFPQDCALCHGTSAATWNGTAAFDHATTGFTLIGTHTNLQCAQCHANNNFSLTSGACWGCHQTDYNNTTDPPHKTASFPQDCSGCHTSVNWNGATFNHATTGFALVGLHATQQCAGCHVNNNYSIATTACISCHLTDFNGANDPPHKAGGFPQDCTLCHGSTAANWTSAKFDHATTGFTLTGAHNTAQCAQCHVADNYNLTSGACWGCHQTDFNNTKTPPHKAANFAQDCSGCHNTTNWDGATFNHATTGFALVGLHATQQCAGCHVNNNYTLNSTACSACHLSDYNGATNPPHKSAGFPLDCTQCHGAAALNWTGGAFDHKTTGFPLTGAHLSTQCAQCHVNDNYSLSSGACWNCHQTDFNNTKTPPHKSANFPQDCSGCHNTTNWDGATFNHAPTGFALAGVHATQQCAACHVNSNYTLASAACINCHLTDFNGTTNPPHKSAGFPLDCAVCHGTGALNWTSATFNHTSTGFALTGAHVSTQCVQCHGNNNYNLTSGTCWNCHQTDFNNTKNPPHKSANFPQDCSGCHTTTNWDGATFNHTTTGFALTGAHTSAQCAQCHANNNYALTSGACWNCHQTEFNNTINPPHKSANFPQDCAGCHTTTNWNGATFNHATTGFELVGVHNSQQCTACHVNGNYTLTSAACINCHLADFNGTDNPPHKAAGFPQDCAVCHGTSALNWSNATFNHTTTGFALVGLHATQQCTACHVNGNYTLSSAACGNCHLADYNRTSNPPHKSAGFPMDCALCHGSSATNWSSATFNHTTTGFTLTGAHVSAQCVQCHVSNNYSLTSGACWNCHQADYTGTKAPPHKAGNFPQDCGGCHNTTNWDGATFNHTTTGFALVGLHAAQQCATCHVNNNYNLTSGACWGCHQTDYNGANSPPHKASGFPQDCTQCHGSGALNWDGATFNHTSTGFALVGLHATQQCATCHVNNNYNLTSAACWGCHQTDYNGANSPPHKASGFAQDCTGCHGSAALNWTSATFNHATTGFTLVGLHATQQCATCHVNNNYNLTSGACFGCHQTDYNGAMSPPHKAANFSQDCSGCHLPTVLNWDGATFSHATTGFTLVGLHATQQCAACHVNNNYTLNSTACWGCHQTDYNGANSPPHKAAGFPQDCTGCHGSAALNWTSATFNHATTGFTLVGLHATQQCAACHVNNNYTLSSTACFGCHQTDYNGAMSPPHKSANFSQDCTGCHLPTILNWDGATFNHATTGFTLVGLHATQQCAACHVNNNYTLSSTACWGCHQTDYNGAMNPPHKSGNFSQDCTTCHPSTMLNWDGATFNHTSTGFALVGLHASQQCATCHVNNNYAIPNATCWNCHQTDYNGAMSPPHKASGFPQDCTGCHPSTILNWDGATFNHASTGFTLTGAHTSQQCAACHVNNNYSLTSGACWNCHQTDYNGAMSPPHKSGGFPQDCSGCHTTTNWDGATFNHTTTGFALTGTHSTTQCAACHVNNNYSLTSAACWNCHQTDYNGTNAPAHQAAGFPQDCSVCHSTTNWAGATFTHPTTPLQLTGFHATMLSNNQCVQCHVGNNYTSTPSDCYSCHKTDYQNTTNPGHTAAGFATTCNTCHTFVDWTGATYTAHDSAYFPIYSGNHKGKWTSCGDCHTNSANYAVFTCIACHQHSNQTSVTSNHKGVKNFVYNATSCYGCHPRGSS